MFQCSQGVRRIFVEQGVRAVNVNQVFRAGFVGKISVLDLKDEVMSVERVDGAAIDKLF